MGNMIVPLDNLLNEFEPQGVADLLIGANKEGEVHSHNFFREGSLLIAGIIGSGMDITINQMVLSGMFNKNPKNIQFAFYDPKQTSFREYKSSPFLVKELMSSIEEMESYLKELKELVEKRYEILKSKKTKHIEEYNRYAIKKDKEPLPHIITVIEGLEHITLQKPEVTDLLVEILQKSRAVGIYFLIGVSTPMEGVLSGKLKAVLSGRIAMKVSNEMESLRVIDETGAERLNSHGEMIYKNPQGKQSVLQSAFVSAESIISVCNYVNEEYNGMK